jgi:glycosyltransferase involved in cell wall biosynthesis
MSTKTNKISAVILAKNEEENIEKCIESLDFCDEVVVVDDNSSDRTRKIAKRMGARVFKHSMNKNYAKQSNFGMRRAKNEWILFIDADERISPPLQNEIIQSVENADNINGLYFKRIDFMWGKWLKHGEISAFRALRMVRRNSGKWVRRVHPHFNLDGNTSTFKNTIEHYPHPTVAAFLNSIDRWSSWHALANQEEGKNANLFKILKYPPLKFLYNYIWRKGFLDGMQGFVFAMFMSFHSYLSWGKLWIRQQTKN